MVDDTDTNDVLTVVLDNLLLNEMTDRDLDITPRGLDYHYRSHYYSRRLPFVVVETVLEAGPTGLVMWRDFRSWRTTLRRFLEAGIDRYPCWHFSDASLAPIDLSNKIILSSIPRGSAFARRRRDPISLIKSWDDFSSTFYTSRPGEADENGGARLGPDAMPTRSAASIFSRLFSKSLTAAALNSGAPPTLFEVHSKSRGYRIHWTYQYWLSPVVFGSPSTPVTGKLASGFYRFGGDQRGVPLTWDRGIHEVSSSVTRADLVDF
jgi:hypothetical protein